MYNNNSSNSGDSSDESNKPSKIDKPIQKERPSDEKKKPKKKIKKLHKTKTKILKKIPSSNSSREDNGNSSGVESSTKKKLKITRWEVKHVLKWLEKIGLVKEFPNTNLLGIFENNDINGKALLLLENEDLKEMGIQSVGVRKALLFHIEDIKKRLGNELSLSVMSTGIPFNMSRTHTVSGSYGLPNGKNRITSELIFREHNSDDFQDEDDSPKHSRDESSSNYDSPKSKKDNHDSPKEDSTNNNNISINLKSRESKSDELTSPKRNELKLSPKIHDLKASPKEIEQKINEKSNDQKISPKENNHHSNNNNNFEFIKNESKDKENQESGKQTNKNNNNTSTTKKENLEEKLKLQFKIRESISGDIANLDNYLESSSTDTDSDSLNDTNEVVPVRPTRTVPPLKTKRSGGESPKKVVNLNQSENLSSLKIAEINLRGSAPNIKENSPKNSPKSSSTNSPKSTNSKDSNGVEIPSKDSPKFVVTQPLNIPEKKGSDPLKMVSPKRPTRMIPNIPIKPQKVEKVEIEETKKTVTYNPTKRNPVKSLGDSSQRDSSISGDSPTVDTVTTESNTDTDRTDLTISNEELITDNTRLQRSKSTSKVHEIGSRISSKVFGNTSERSSVSSKNIFDLMKTNNNNESPQEHPHATAFKNKDPSFVYSREVLVEITKDPLTTRKQFVTVKRLPEFLQGVELFDKKAKDGIAFFQQKLNLSSDPKYIGQFLYIHRREFNEKELGQYLTREENQEMFGSFISTINFADLEIDCALRHMLHTFALPGEGQIVDRVIKIFSEKYYEENKETGEIRSDKAARALAFSVMLLNTDAHSSQVANKMTLKQFFRNNQGFNDGEDFSEELLTDIYNRITHDEFKLEANPLSESTKSGYLLVRRGSILAKKRWVILHDNVIYESVKPPVTGKKWKQDPPTAVLCLKGCKIEPPTTLSFTLTIYKDEADGDINKFVVPDCDISTNWQPKKGQFFIKFSSTSNRDIKGWFKQIMKVLEKEELKEKKERERKKEHSK